MAHAPRVALDSSTHSTYSSQSVSHYHTPSRELMALPVHDDLTHTSRGTASISGPILSSRVDGDVYLLVAVFLDDSIQLCLSL